MEVLTGLVILFVVGVVVVGFIRGYLSAKNEPDMDANGNMRCKRCGGAAFGYWKNNDGSTTYECHHCGKRWTRF